MWHEFLEYARRDPPRVALVLGSGLGHLIERLEDAIAVSFGDVPGLVAPTVHGHKGQLLLGRWAEQSVLVFQGRLHFYEGHPWERVGAPIRLAAELGARVLVLTNAAGGINATYRPGSLMALTDHIVWNRPTAWKAERPPSPYDPELLAKLRQAATDTGVSLHEGVYLAVTGPSYETPAEIRAMRTAGADAVGMSTAFEATTARELGLRVAAISCITNAAAGMTAGPLDHQEVLAMALAQGQRLADLLETLVEKLG